MNILNYLNSKAIFTYIRDFNADSTDGWVWRNLNDFIFDNHLVCRDIDSLSNNTYAFISSGNSPGKRLDRDIKDCGEDYVTVQNVRVLDDVIGSDHLSME